jgi:hypothetical protein
MAGTTPASPAESARVATKRWLKLPAKPRAAQAALQTSALTASTARRSNRSDSQPSGKAATLVIRMPPIPCSRPSSVSLMLSEIRSGSATRPKICRSTVANRATRISTPMPYQAATGPGVRRPAAGSARAVIRPSAEGWP